MQSSFELSRDELPHGLPKAFGLTKVPVTPLSEIVSHLPFRQALKSKALLHSGHPRIRSHGTHDLDASNNIYERVCEMVEQMREMRRVMERESRRNAASTSDIMSSSSKP